MRLFIISNRLPLTMLKNGSRFILKRSEGGLATGLDSLRMNIEKHWIGWPGVYTDAPDEQEEIRSQLQAYHFYPVFLTSRQIKEYYEGYSNSTLWPLCHYFFSYVQHETYCWETYRQVNELFCTTALSLIQDEDIVWIHDYQLMLLPGMLRKKLPLVSIGYFHHIPFPAYELFRILPEKTEIIKGLLGADLIAFHTNDYMRYFMIAAQRVSGIDFNEGEVQLSNRIVHVDAFAMGINYSLYYDSPLRPEVRRYIHELKEKLGENKLILTVDRLDYSKGIVHRLKGFSIFLTEHPEYKEKISMVMIIVPSRNNVERYASLKTHIDEMVSSINGTFSTIDWTPIHYYYYSFPFDELVAIYHIADIALVTPLRDGMNLVAKEYIASKRNQPGVLILSEMAGAAIELPEAVIVNPNDVQEISHAIFKAITMPVDRQLKKLRKMQSVLARQTVDKWAEDFVSELQYIHHKNNILYRKTIGDGNMAMIRQAYRQAHHRLIILDYDGTLVGFTDDPQDAVPTPELYKLLSTFIADPENTMVICSGRDHETLEKWFGHMHLRLAAEHGAFYKASGKWEEKIHREPWNDEIIHIIQKTIRKTPGSMLEIKRTSIVWHYRNVNSWLGYLREQQLISELRGPCRQQGLQIMKGSKIVEIKLPEFTKGSVVHQLLSQDHYDFLMAIGDDTTDEDMFTAMPPEAFTIKIGPLSQNARYNLYAQSQTLPFLRNLIAH